MDGLELKDTIQFLKYIRNALVCVFCSLPIKELQSPLQSMANLAPLDSWEYKEQLLNILRPS